MELATVKDAFDRAAKRQKLSSSKTLEIVDQVIKEIELAISTIQANSSDGNAATALNHEYILLDLKTKLNDMAPLTQIENCEKEANAGFNKCTKIVEKFFNPDISKAYRNVETDSQITNEIIASHLYRDALFDIGDRFVHEVNCSAASSLNKPFQEMYEILGALKSGNLEPALTWATKNRDNLLENGSVLEMKLHQLQFVDILEQGNRDEALRYARRHLAPFAPVHKTEIQKLMASILWAGRLNQSPYAEFLSPTNLEKLAGELTKQFCSLLGLSSTSPLSVAVAAGTEVLPTLLKLTTVMAAKKEWQAMKQLPFLLDLRSDFQFHSVFICPVLKDQGTDENPPMLLPCGHVLSKFSITKLSRNSTRPFKCPYCPSEATMLECKQLHL